MKTATRAPSLPHGQKKASLNDANHHNGAASATSAPITHPQAATASNTFASLDGGIFSTVAANSFKTGVLSTEQLLKMYRTMFLIRRVEESLLALAESGKIGGAMHTSIGQEASAVGIAAALRPDEYLNCTIAAIIIRWCAGGSKGNRRAGRSGGIRVGWIVHDLACRD